MRSKKDDILEAAATLFSHKGVDGVSVPQILTLANASAGAMYSYFKSKQELADAVFRRADQAVYGALWHQFPYQIKVKEQFYTLWRRYFRLLDEDRLSVSLSFLNSCHEVDLGETHEQMLRELCQIWREDVDAHIEISVDSMVLLIRGVMSYTWSVEAERYMHLEKELVDSIWRSFLREDGDS
mgnify:CR=1 FL=1